MITSRPGGSVSAANQIMVSSSQIEELEDQLRGLVPELLDCLGTDARALEEALTECYLSARQQLIAHGMEETAVLSLELLLASHHGQLDVVAELIERGADVNARNRHGESALMIATLKGNVEIVSLLLKKGATVDSRDARGWTSLGHAVGASDFEIAQLLLDRGANPHLASQESGYKRNGNHVVTSPFMMAVAQGDARFIRLLLAHGADANAFESGLTPLHAACLDGHADVVTMLLHSGADSSIASAVEPGLSPLGFALTRGHYEIGELLLAGGCGINQGTTAVLESACAVGDSMAVEWMCAHGADPNQEVRSGRFTFLSIAAQRGHISVMQPLIKYGAHLNTPIYQPPIINAAHEGHLEAVRIMVDAGADVNAVDHRGFTALDYAIARKHNEIAEALRSVGASCKADQIRNETERKRKFLRASRKGDLQAVRELLDAGMDPNLRDGNQRTALHFAVHQGHAHVAETLLDRGADPNAKDASGRTPLAWASFVGNLEMVELLLIAGAEDPVALLLGIQAGRCRIVEILLNERGIRENRPLLGKALFNASANGQSGIVALLLSVGADVHYRHPKTKATPLLIACLQSYLEVVEQLIEAGALLEARERTRSFTPLLAAAQGGHTKIAALLLKAGAELGVTNLAGQMSLHIACSLGHEDMVDFLLRSGLDAHAKDASGKTALYYAKRKNHGGIVKLLTDCRAKD